MVVGRNDMDLESFGKMCFPKNIRPQGNNDKGCCNLSLFCSFYCDTFSYNKVFLWLFTVVVLHVFNPNC